MKHKTSKTSLYFDEDDQAVLATVKQRTGISSTSAVIRYALRHLDAALTPSERRQPPCVSEEN